MKVLETERLVLRRFTAGDAEFILRLLNEPSFLCFVGDRGVRTLDDAREYIRKGPLASYEEFGFGLFLTEHKEDGAPIGICGLIKRETLEDVDVGFAFVPEYWGEGYATESATAVVAHGKSTFGLERLVAVVSPENHASIRVLEKLGLSFERMIRMSGDEIEIKLFSSDL